MALKTTLECTLLLISFFLPHNCIVTLEIYYYVYHYEVTYNDYVYMKQCQMTE